MQKLIEETGVIKPYNCAELEKRAALMTRLDMHHMNLIVIILWHNFYTDLLFFICNFFL
jgi:hypothetical protein